MMLITVLRILQMQGSEKGLEGYSVADQLESRGKSQAQSSVVKTVLRIIILGTVLNFVVAALSFLTLSNRVLYEGPLQQHLPIFSGEIHFARVPKQYWQHRILMLKAMGLNSLSVYVMWNFHQLSRGHFDFVNGDKDLAGFLGLAQKHQMKVLLRPGPYVCAEWDFGGLPARLLGINDLQIRSTDPVYQSQVKIYFSALAPIIKPFLFANGGPIIMLQIQNQLGYVRDTPEHTLHLIQMWKDLNIKSEFYYEDPQEVWRNNYWKGAHIGLSESSNMLKYLNLELSSIRSKDSLIFGGEVYSGWFTDWGDQGWSRKSGLDFGEHIENLVNHNRSVSLYMGFGGTNFGMTAGANGFNPLYSYMAHITSYDYDSPISEEGKATEKYRQLRQVFQRYYGEGKQLMTVPQAIKTISIPSISTKKIGNLFSNLGEPAVKEGDLAFFQSPALKMYDQGIVLYQTILPTSGKYLFKATLRDYASIFINELLVQTFVRRYSETFNIKVECLNAPCKMWVVVEAMGHINFGRKQGLDKKGMLDFVDLKEKGRVYRWNIYKFPLDEGIFKWKEGASKSEYFGLSRSTFNLTEVGDTFFDMREYGKGYLWVNGHNLGRYWEIGPQYRLYCPGVWLKKGENELFVLQLGSKHGEIKGFEVMA